MEVDILCIPSITVLIGTFPYLMVSCRYYYYFFLYKSYVAYMIHKKELMSFTVRLTFIIKITTTIMTSVIQHMIFDPQSYF